MKKHKKKTNDKNRKGKPKRNDRRKATALLKKLQASGNETKVKRLEKADTIRGTRTSAKATITRENRPAEMAREQTSPEQIRLLAAAKNGDPAAIETVVRQNRSFVRTLARRPNRPECDFDDLVQEGYLAILFAIKKYNLYSDLSFAAQAEPWIVGRMSRFAASTRGAVRVPEYKQQEMRQIKKAIQQLKLKLDRNPTPQEVAARTNFELKKVEGLMALIYQEQDNLSLDDELSTTGEDHAATLSDQVADESYHTETTARTREVRRLARSLLRVLTAEQRTVIRLRFGLRNGAPPLSHVEIGKKLGISRESSTRLEQRALARLRTECLRLKIKIEDLLEL